MKVGYRGVKWKSKAESLQWVAPLKLLKRGIAWVSVSCITGFSAVMVVSVLMMSASPSKGVGKPGMVIALPALAIAIAWMFLCIQVGPRLMFRWIANSVTLRGQLFVGLNHGSSTLLLHALNTEYQDIGWLSVGEDTLRFEGELHSFEIPRTDPSRVEILKQVFGNQRRSILQIDVQDRTYFLSTPDPRAEVQLIRLVQAQPSSQEPVKQVLRGDLASLTVVEPLKIGGKNLWKIGLLALVLLIPLQVITAWLMRDSAGMLIGAFPLALHDGCGSPRAKEAGGIHYVR
ncbi:MAG: hypothetical protein CBB60_002715 [Armatimonadetes bacterium Cent15-Ar3]|nr:MAG: hypothetical protein CBB60_002715 [Armatimonadetes bacterium Cent15-Ar3]